MVLGDIQLQSISYYGEEVLVGMSGKGSEGIASQQESIRIESAVEQLNQVMIQATDFTSTKMDFDKVNMLLDEYANDGGNLTYKEQQTFVEKTLESTLQGYDDSKTQFDAKDLFLTMQWLAGGVPGSGKVIRYENDRDLFSAAFKFTDTTLLERADNIINDDTMPSDTVTVMSRLVKEYKDKGLMEAQNNNRIDQVEADFLKAVIENFPLEDYFFNMDYY